MTRTKATSFNGTAKVAVLFDRLGPYHHARLSAAAQRLHVLAVEFCGETKEYAWDPIATGSDFRRVTLFPQQSSENVQTGECRRKVFDCLDADSPAAVAVPGWGSPFALSALAWCAQRKRPAIIMSESTAWDEPRRTWKEFLKRRIVGNGAAGLVGGHPHAEYLTSLGIPPQRIFIGYDAVDNSYFENATDVAHKQAFELRKSLGLPDQFFLASNRFLEKKNLPVLLEAYAAYRRETGAGAWSLVLLGDGPQRPELLRRMTELGLDHAVQMPGFKQYEALPAYYALASGFIHASKTEQWGLVVNEAMACALPVLVSNRCGCAADLVAEGQNGWTFDPSDVQAVTAALKRLSASSDQERAAMGQASRARIAAWSPEAFAQGLKNAVDAALSTPAPKASLFDKLLLRTLAVR